MSSLHYLYYYISRYYTYILNIRTYTYYYIQ